MKFRLIYKKLGIKAFDVFSEFEYPTSIKDVCFVKDIGFFCLGEKSLIIVAPQLCQEVMAIDNPMSICNADHNLIYVSYSGGIKSINYRDNYHPTDIWGSSTYQEVFGNLSKIGVRDVFINFHAGKIGIAIPHIHKIFMCNGDSVEKTYGSGVPEYNIASKVKNCAMSNPHGILVYNSNTLFVSDTDNGCIRSFGESHRIIIGKPMTSEIRPTKLLTNKSRNVLYYLSKNYLRSSNIDGSRDAVLYESDKIKSFALTDEDKAFVLEETNE